MSLITMSRVCKHTVFAQVLLRKCVRPVFGSNNFVMSGKRDDKIIDNPLYAGMSLKELLESTDLFEFGWVDLKGKKGENLVILCVLSQLMRGINVR